MFKAPWNKTSRETVKRKKSRKKHHRKVLSGRSTVRSSKSTISGTLNMNSSTESLTLDQPYLLFGFFNIKKKVRLLSKLPPSKIDASLSSKALNHNLKSSSSSPFISVGAKAPTGLLNGVQDRSTTITESPSDESRLSGWTGCSVNTNSTWSDSTDLSTGGRLVQPLSAGSYVTQSTEITVSSRDVIDPSEQLATIVHISAAGTIPVRIRHTSSKLSIRSETFNFPIPRAHLIDEPSFTVSGNDNEMSPSELCTRRGRNSDNWRPPDEWCCTTEDLITTKSPTSIEPLIIPIRRSSCRLRERRVSMVPSDLSHLRKTIRCMEAAGPKLNFERLNEEWVEALDDSVNQELELEKQLWMLSALQSFNRKKTLPQQVNSLALENFPSTKALSLYENQASASYLAALSPHPEVHHLATIPLSPNAYPNIHPLAIPGPTAQLPYATSIFSSISAISLPSLLTSSSLPIILKECHRILTPGGSLHLTLLDPYPVHSTIGPRLRNWLNKHLLINLERQFRCISPTRLFPHWLSDASLRGSGSSISKVRFHACFAPQPMSSEEEDAKERIGREHKLELKSQAGRMLWKDMWGGFVEGESWWWDDEDIIDECERLGTAWEYSAIEAVKEE